MKRERERVGVVVVVIPGNLQVPPSTSSSAFLTAGVLTDFALIPDRWRDPTSLLSGKTPAQ